jgi:outer membrane lipoprotein-sorting protein
MLKKILASVVAIVAVIAFGGAVSAMEGPKVEYSADSYLETSEAVMKGPLYYAPGKERRDYLGENGEKMVMITRSDKKAVWMLMPEEKTFMEMKLSGQGRKDDLSAYKVEQTMIGPETVNGVNAVKSKLVMIAPDGGKLGGFVWTTREGIVVKMDAISVEKGGKERFTINLQNLKIGRQDPELFEVPAGYTAMDMGGIGKSLFGGDEGGEDEKPQPQDKGKKKGFGFKDAFDLLK